MMKNNSLKTKYSIDFKNYKKDCIEAEKGNLNKLYKVIYAKKLYSVPWLIAGNILIEKYPQKTTLGLNGYGHSINGFK